MVVAEGPNEYILYMQNDHGDLAGQLPHGAMTGSHLRATPWCSLPRRR
jgi:hypothetical protein